MSAHPIDVHVGKRLRMRRNMLGLSQEELGRSVGVTFQQVQKYERGTNRVGSSRLYEFSRILSVPVGYFFDKLNATEMTLGFEEEAEAYESAPRIDSKETMNLIQAYYRIEDTALRQKIMSLMKAMAGGNTTPAPTPKRGRKTES